MTRNNADFDEAASPRVPTTDLSFTQEPHPLMGSHTVIRAHHPEHGQVGVMILEEPWHGDNSVRNDRAEYTAGSRRIRWVESRYKRQGIGQAMFNWAKEQGLNPVHSQQLTTEGRAFAESGSE